MTDRTELRRLLDASKVPWDTYRPNPNYARYVSTDNRGDEVAYMVEDPQGKHAEMVVAAVNALPSLLNQLDAVRELADRIDRHTEVEPDPAMFRDSDTGVWWEVSDAIRAALAQPTTEGVTHERLPML